MRFAPLFVTLFLFFACAASAFADDGQTASAVQKPGSEPCATCHEGSYGKIHWNYTAMRYPADADCLTCHDHEKTTYKKLTRAVVPMLAEAGINPHRARTMCFTCHDGANGAGPVTSDPVSTCTVCHCESDVNVNGHVFGFAYEPTDMVRIPKRFPLADGGVVTCTTCHEFRCDRGGNGLANFLRVTETPAKFCYNCHFTDGIDRYSPHHQIRRDGTLDRQTCTVCHVEEPDPAVDHGYESVELKGELNDVCTGCHWLREDHPTGALHTVVPSPGTRRTMERQMKKLDVYFPLGKDGAVLCVTCHTAHEYAMIDGHALDRFLKRTRLSGGKQLCRVCHDK